MPTPFAFLPAADLLRLAVALRFRASEPRPCCLPPLRFVVLCAYEEVFVLLRFLEVADPSRLLDRVLTRAEPLLVARLFVSENLVVLDGVVLFLSRAINAFLQELDGAPYNL